MIILGSLLFIAGIMIIFINNNRFLHQIIGINIIVLGCVVNFIYFSAFKINPEYGKIIAIISLIIIALETLLAVTIFKKISNQQKTEK